MEGSTKQPSTDTSLDKAFNYDQVNVQTKITLFSKEVSASLKGHSYEQRCNWI